ncbi:hypothetical protein [uncultured Corynebacterium sp.]|uniref:hypothetical protein n=1 Tax=uncultured Corynebacterium sp. TaxID=159447 RepID=UPI0025E894B9|nr:hypothetical protein [uncultured Corynebacterium sp.]
MGLWTLAALLLLILSVTVVVAALDKNPSSSGDGDSGRSALESAAAEASRPTEQQQAEDATLRIESVVADISDRFDAKVGVSLRAGGGVVHAGESGDLHAWSSVKVPVAFAAVQHQLDAAATGAPAVDLTGDLALALTRSDNDAALRLWETLGTDEESSVAVDGVFRQAGDPTDAEADRDREGYEGFGDIHWTLDNQVIFANRMSCLPGAEQVLDPMGHVIDEHRQGLGLLPGSRFKGGWGNEADGSYVLREFGLVGAPGRQVPVAFSVVPADAGDTTAREAAAALAHALEPVIADLADAGGAAECQVPASVPAAV